MNLVKIPSAVVNPDATEFLKFGDMQIMDADSIASITPKEMREGDRGRRTISVITLSNGAVLYSYFTVDEIMFTIGNAGLKCEK